MLAPMGAQREGHPEDAGVSMNALLEIKWVNTLQ